MGIFDFFSSGDDTGRYLGNTMNPQVDENGTVTNPATADQFVKARLQDGLLGLAAGLMQGGAPSRLPVSFATAFGTGIQGMMGAQKDLTAQALQAANAGSANADTGLKYLQGKALKQDMAFQQQGLEAMKQAYLGGGVSPLTGAPTNPATGVVAPGPAVALPTGDLVNAARVAANKYGVPEDMFVHQINGESSFNPNIGTNSTGHSGIAQFDPQTAHQYGVDVNDPISSLNGAARYMADLYGKTGDWPTAMRSYLGATTPAGLQGVLTTNPSYAKAYALAQAAGASPAQAAEAAAASSRQTGGSTPPVGGVMGAALGGPQSSQNAPQASVVRPGTMLAQAAGGAPTPAPAPQMTPRPTAPVGVSPQAQTPMPAVPAGAPVSGLISSPPPGYVAAAIPPGFTPFQVGQARLAVGIAALRGKTPDPTLAKIAGYAIDVGMKNEELQNQKKAELAYAGPITTATQTAQKQVELQYGPQIAAANTTATKGAEAPFNTVEVMINGVKMKIPQDQYMKLMQGANPGQQAQAQPQGGAPQPGQPMGQGAPQAAPANGMPNFNQPGFAQTPIPPPAFGERVYDPLQQKQIEANINSNPNAFAVGPAAGANKEKIPVMPSPDHPFYSVIPPLANIAPTFTSKEGMDANAKSAQAQIDSWSKATTALPVATQRLEAIADLMRDYKTGSFAQISSDVVAKARVLGIPTDWLNDPSKMQQILKDNYSFAVESMKATGLARWTQAELFAGQKNFANTDLQPSANHAIVAQTLGNLYREQAEMADWQAAQKVAQGPIDPAKFDQAWSRDNPLNRYIDIAKVKMGPFAGMDKNEIAAALPRVSPSKAEGVPHSIQSGNENVPFVGIPYGGFSSNVR